MHWWNTISAQQKLKGMLIGAIFDGTSEYFAEKNHP